ncbi:MAG: hypothetical protein JST40_12495 [Armatimonadetes bacterium]|nr:hypothetical protein [Armatimonadota bacterium]
MNLARLLVAIAVLILVVGGYIASQFAVWSGTTAQYAQRIDTEPVKMLALVLFVGIVALTIARKAEAPE